MTTLLALPAALALAITAFNLATWPTPRRRGTPHGTVTVAIPARNEERTIAACVSAALAQDGITEVLVYDDGSTDATPDLLAAIDDPRLRVLTGVPLPDGWIGKPHACHRLALAATGELLVFVDADTFLEPGAIARIAAALDAYDADALTAVPEQVTGTAAEALMLPLLHLTYTAWLPLVLVHRSRRPVLTAANGQVFAVTREALDAAGGFSAVGAEVVDDVALARALKRAGRRVVFGDGRHLARCRMYESGADLWKGFSKNVYEGLGHPVLLAFVLALYLTAFVLPYGLLAAGIAGMGWALLPGAVGVVANLLTRGALAWRFGHRWWSVLAHPIAVVALVALALNSWRWSLTGRIEWAGRVYAARHRRGHRA